MEAKRITPLGITNCRNTNKHFGTKGLDRATYIYSIGKTGFGKSNLLFNMAVLDIEKGNGLCVVDPHGEISKDILDYIPKHRIQDISYFNATDAGYPIAFNRLKGIHPNFDLLVAIGLISSFKKLWFEPWAPRPRYAMYLKLMADSATSVPFNAYSLQKKQVPPNSVRIDVISSSRTHYTHPRSEVDASIISRHPIIGDNSLLQDSLL